MNMRSLLAPVLALCFLIAPQFASASPAPLALVWDGPGACKPNCTVAAARVARIAGFRTQYVQPGFTDYSIFKEATLWVQPGGHSTTAADSMGPELIAQIQDFVRNGGGYVGFCAGGFISTAKIGESDRDGFGLIPGETELLIKDGNDHQMLKVTTNDGDRMMYYAGGPFFKVTDEQLKAVQGDVFARYADGSIAGIHAHYGKGKVAVVGFHPEAGWAWKLLRGKIDPDGSDIFFAVDMVNYVTQSE